MAYVKSWTMRFEGEVFTVRIRFRNKSGLFLISLPRVVKNCLGYDEVMDDTLKAVEKKFKAAIKEYKEAQTTHRKVIIYKIASQARVWEGTEEDGCVAFQDDTLHFASGTGLAIWADVLDEAVTKRTGIESHIYYTHLDSSLPDGLHSAKHRVTDQYGYTSDGIHIIDWTQEREDWFAAMGRSLESMIVNIHKTLNDEDKVLKLADAGHLLMGPSVDV